ncbi:hypothetical protein QBC38DRAFT_456151 [Podospora fimiseda]|uniref:Uncharacterized protein n=1 Tax=Podospora fimiseda TaxID=252190 RepID=A0AAN7BNM6_9PEZI|nr:hypothetical protein QBC38DRAFT_456151 [Podospora fimiseda]
MPSTSKTNPPDLPPLTTQILSDPLLSEIIPSSPDDPRRRERAMSSTSEWKPSDRRQSFSAQEYLHEFHEKLAKDHDQHTSPVQSQNTAFGFTERRG